MLEFLLQGGKLDMARSAAPDRAHHHPPLFALVDELLEGPDRRILLHAELPAQHAPAVDRNELARLVAGASDHLVDRAAGRRLRHHHVAVRPGGVELGARNPPARPQDIFEAGLHPLLLEIGLDHARGGVDRSAGRLIDDPVDVAGRKLLLRRCGRADGMLPAAVTPSAAFPALSRKPRRSICNLLLILVLLSCPSRLVRYKKRATCCETRRMNARHSSTTKSKCFPDGA